MSRLLFPHSFTSFRPFSVGPSSTGHIQLNPQPNSALPRRILPKLMASLRRPLVLGMGLWLMVWVWNWPIAIAIATGTIGAIAVYLYQLRRLHVSWFDRWSSKAAFFSRQTHWQEKFQQVSDRIRPWIMRSWSQCWSQGNRSLTISLLSGGAVTSVVATMALIYRDLHSKSLVLAMALQILVILGLGWALWRQNPISPSPSLKAASPDSNKSTVRTASSELSSEQTIHTIDQLWADLISKDTSIRLIAIYRSVHWVQTLKSNPNPTLVTAMDATKLTACFRVMLSHESNPSVQQALRDGLMNLQK